MRTARVLWRLTMTCAALLVVAPFTPRTTWQATSRGAGGSLIIEGVGWQAIAALIGVGALVVLVAGFSAQRRESAVAGAVIATFGFVVLAVGMTWHWIDLMNGVTSVNPAAGWGSFPVPGWDLRPAPFIPVFAALAAAGAVLACALAVVSLRSASGGHPTRRKILAVDGLAPHC
jgi:hypothetical protein